MAASAAEKDYVHLVIRGIEMKTGRKADVQMTARGLFWHDGVQAHPGYTPPQGSGPEYPRGLKGAGWGVAPCYPQG